MSLFQLDDKRHAFSEFSKRYQYKEKYRLVKLKHTHKLYHKNELSTLTLLQVQAEKLILKLASEIGDKFPMK